MRDRSLRIFGIGVIRRRRTRFMREYFTYAQRSRSLTFISGCDPLTPDDVAEVIVFAAGRRENVVVADTLLFPNHQVRQRTVSTFYIANAYTGFGDRHPSKAELKLSWLCHVQTSKACLIINLFLTPHNHKYSTVTGGRKRISALRMRWVE
jgi:hypothetical protein